MPPPPPPVSGQVTFREVFLRSTAVDLLVDNLLRAPPVDAEEEVLVTELLSCTLVGGTPTATEVLRRVVDASHALQGYARRRTRTLDSVPSHPAHGPRLPQQETCCTAHTFLC